MSPIKQGAWGAAAPQSGDLGVTPPTIFDEFDAVVCITLGDSIERHKKLSRVFEDIGAHPRFHVADRHPNGGRYGCFESHYDVCLEAQRQDLDHVLIFEDDIVTTRGYDEAVMREVVSFVRENETWECVQLGYGPSLHLVFGSRVSKNIARNLGCFTHALCLSRRGIVKILASAPAMLELKRDIPHYDLWLADGVLDQRNCFSVIPMQFDQQWCFETTNVSATFFEAIVRRQFGCIAGRMHLMYYVSLVAYYIWWWCIASIVVMVVLGYFVSALRKDGSRAADRVPRGGNRVALGRIGVRQQH